MAVVRRERQGAVIDRSDEALPNPTSQQQLVGRLGRAISDKACRWKVWPLRSDNPKLDSSASCCNPSKPPRFSTRHCAYRHGGHLSLSISCPWQLFLQRATKTTRNTYRLNLDIFLLSEMHNEQIVVRLSMDDSTGSSPSLTHPWCSSVSILPCNSITLLYPSLLIAHHMISCSCRYRQASSSHHRRGQQASPRVG